MISALLLVLLSPAAAQPQVAASTPTAYVPAARLLSEAEYPRFEESFPSKAGLIKAARRAIKYLESLPPKTIRVADRDYGPAQLADSAKTIIELAQKAKTADEFDARVRENFDVFQSTGLDGKGRVVFSSYYQPMLKASLKKTPAYPYPLYRRPKDLVEVDLASFGAKAGEQPNLLGRLTKDGKVVPYYTREEIDRRAALAGKGLEIAWLKDRFDALDLHIQGSAILKLTNGKEVLAKYAGNNAKNYNSVGLTLVKAGVFARDEITHDKLREYLHKNPDAESWILAQNPRYVFFELAPLPEDGEPFGATEQSLVPARAIAVDPAFMPLGGLYFFSTTSPQIDKEGRLLGMSENTRFAFGLDTGGAIKSPGRVDIYAGHGAQAAATARGQWADGKLYLLVKKLPPRAL